jgi:hypothetical protein
MLERQALILWGYTCLDQFCFDKFTNVYVIIPTDSKRGIEKIDFYRSRFFWQGDEEKQKYRLTKWNIICRPKDQGGLGIEVLELKNKCLLSK